MQKIKVLVAEDEGAHQGLIEELLNREGYSVTLVDRAVDAIKEIEKHFWTALVVDLTLNKDDGSGTKDPAAGVQIMTYCQKHRPFTKCVVITQRDHSDTDILIQCLEAGAFRWIYKSNGKPESDLVFKTELVKKVREAVNFYVDDLGGRQFLRQQYALSLGCPIFPDNPCSLKDEICDHEYGYKDKNVFLAIPYKKSYDVRLGAIQEVLKAVGLNNVLAKQQKHHGTKLCRVCSAIRKCKYVIADVSTPDCVNVMYEVGISQVLGRRVGLLFNESDDQQQLIRSMPWDITPLSPINYAPSDDAIIDRLQSNLANWLILNASGDIDLRKAAKLIKSQLLTN